MVGKYQAVKQEERKKLNLKLKLINILGRLDIKSANLTPLERFLYSFDFESLAENFGEPDTLYVDPKSVELIKEHCLNALSDIKDEETDNN